jgi:hypothetical protein
MGTARLRGNAEPFLLGSAWMKKKAATAAPRTCEECARWQEVRKKIRISRALEKAIRAIEAKLESEELKPTMGDFLKLLQLEQEFEEATPKQVTVKWVEPEPEPALSEE